MLLLRVLKKLLLSTASSLRADGTQTMAYLLDNE